VCISKNYGHEEGVNYLLHAYQSPPGFWNSLNLVNGLHEELVRNDDLRDPNGAKKVRPFSSASLLEGAPFIWA
jgi:hypothetical protein